MANDIEKDDKGIGILAQRLRELEEQHNTVQKELDTITAPYTKKIDECREKINKLNTELSTQSQDLRDQRKIIEDSMANTKYSILIQWTPSMKKTLKYPEGTLKFRTTQEIHIIDPSHLLTTLIYSFDSKSLIENYVSFRLKGVKKYIDVHPLDAAKLVPKTSVSFTPTQDQAQDQTQG